MIFSYVKVSKMAAKMTKMENEEELTPQATSKMTITMAEQHPQIKIK